MSRSEEILSLYKSGASQAEIGEKYRVSRQRVQQILSKIGISYRQGGRAERVRQAAISVANERAAKFLQKHGMTEVRFNQLNELVSSNGMTPHYAFMEQRRNAMSRGVGWKLNFADWWSVWEESGKWMKRGIYRGEYVMSRPGDTGPYELGNVLIVTNGDNVREARERENAARTTYCDVAVEVVM
jgi:hypothetical protein